MFTGLVEEVGGVLATRTLHGGAQLAVAAPSIADSIRVGDSVAVNGCCLTVASRADEQLTFDLLEETLARTNLRTVRAGASVNLERALAADGRFGGHLVQGHIDCVARTRAFDASGADYRLEIELPSQFAQYVVSKGSIAINGISLTVAELLQDSFVAWIIPHTRRHTNLSSVAAGDWLNIEFDLLAKYVERMLGGRPLQQ